MERKPNDYVGTIEETNKWRRHTKRQIFDVIDSMEKQIRRLKCLYIEYQEYCGIIDRLTKQKTNEVNKNEF